MNNKFKRKYQVQASPNAVRNATLTSVWSQHKGLNLTLTLEFELKKL